ncbi:hypothetical protein [Phytomonospora endophytica]|uniref:Uncharacterized protein n=1 Tax=Phytomonospora endophytica TaxID=714109 RepID=A0A841FDD7_9ACTN|nr:hypothetical protein [Phytomonospora endophytica]MBB6035291.1 hypothetical protein [Phytomonospora endophytica]GIG63960.1 hypothetical protein Pen01_02550 [Phytomonospora endophytica]
MPDSDAQPTVHTGFRRFLSKLIRRPHAPLIKRGGGSSDPFDGLGAHSPLELPWRDPPSVRPSRRSRMVPEWWRRTRDFLGSRVWRARALLAAMIISPVLAILAGSCAYLNSR